MPPACDNVANASTRPLRAPWFSGGMTFDWKTFALEVAVQIAVLWAAKKIAGGV